MYDKAEYLAPKISDRALARPAGPNTDGCSPILARLSFLIPAIHAIGWQMSNVEPVGLLLFCSGDELFRLDAIFFHWIGLQARAREH